jgi:selenocysteine lyase/cysteine desulfurase
LACMRELSKLPGIKIYGAKQSDQQGELFSFTHQSQPPATFSQKLFERHGIETRSGCLAP